jgi:anthranilate synthase component 2
MHIALIDNYDSFTFNLFQYLGELGTAVEVIRNDQEDAEDVLTRDPSGVVLSPGPKTPDQAGMCLAMVAACAARKVPLLGICLGHQCIAHAFGASIIGAPVPMHGKRATLNHDGTGLLSALPASFQVARYHSLMVDPSTVPDELAVNALSDDGVIMAMRHRQLPLHGVQFHPESYAADHGHALLRAFLTIC